MIGRMLVLTAVVAAVALTAPAAMEAAGLEVAGLESVGSAQAATVCTQGYQSHPDGSRSCSGLYIQP